MIPARPSGAMAAEEQPTSDSSSMLGPQQPNRGLCHRFIRQLSMLTLVVHTLVIPASILLFLSILSFPPFWPILLLYGGVIIFDTRSQDGVPLNWAQIRVRKSFWWKAFAQYFPVTLHKTADLEPSNPPVKPSSLYSSVLPWSPVDIPLLIFLWPFMLLWSLSKRFLFASHPKQLIPPTPGKKYLFGVAPHGIISMGALAALGTDGAGWSQLFPGIPVRLLTLTSNFYIPFYRQYLLAFGGCSVSKASCINLLNNNQSIAIVLGGARESLYAEPGRFDIILKERKGFVKVALQTGASLVPVISFGENDLYEQVQFEEGSWGHKVHMFMTHYLGFTIPLFHARGIFSHTKGLLAYRRPVHVVVGRPIDVPLSENPSSEQINYFHGLYVENFKQLYAENVNKYTPGVELNIVE